MLIELKTVPCFGILPSFVEEDTGSENMSDATQILVAVEAGKPDAPEQLLTLLYEELRKLAAHKLAQEPAGQTLQPTALVHEAWLRLISADGRKFENRAHFFSAAAEAMRRILIDRARRRRAQRHGGGQQRVELDDSGLAAPDGDDQLLAVNDALDNFGVSYPAQAQVVKLRYFTGLTNEETAELLGLSVSTVKNYWTFSRAWLFDAIRGK